MELSCIVLTLLLPVSYCGELTDKSKETVPLMTRFQQFSHPVQMNGSARDTNLNLWPWSTSVTVDLSVRERIRVTRLRAAASIPPPAVRVSEAEKISTVTVTASALLPRPRPGSARPVRVLQRVTVGRN